MNRRKFLGLVGGGIIVAAGTGGYVVTRKPQTALQPWAQAGSLYTEPRKKALSYAILAPNPHNRQPWLIDLSSDNEVTIYADTEKLLPHTDPMNRQITIGFGCFLELMTMAAAEDGYAVDIEAFPEGFDNNAIDKRPIARCRFDKSDEVKPDPLFAHVMDRRSLKEPYDMAREVPDSALQALEASANHGTLIDSTNIADQVQSLREITRNAMNIELDTTRTYMESVELFRIGHKEVDANPDGIDFTGPFFESLRLGGLFNREVAAKQEGSLFEQTKDAILGTGDASMAYVWMTTKTNTRIDQINAGRDWIRLNLEVTAQGLGTQPMSQALQEFPEMDEVYKQVHNLLAPEGGTVQMLARLGYGPSVSVSPRWPLDAKLI